MCEGCPNLKGTKPECARLSSYSQPTHSWRERDGSIATNLQPVFPSRITFHGYSGKKLLRDLIVRVATPEEFPTRVDCPKDLNIAEKMLDRFGIGDCHADFTNGSPIEVSESQALSSQENVF
jgi:hypothetical protein